MSIFGDYTKAHYEKEARRASEQFRNLPPDLPPFAEPYEEAPEALPTLEFHDFEGGSTDIEWMSYNHETGEMQIQFLEHGEHSDNAHLYSYEEVPYELYTAITLGSGPFPPAGVVSGVNPRTGRLVYSLARSPGQAVNHHLRNDHSDDLFAYTRL